MNRTGVLLINLGTPDEPTPKAVGRFLREFLMDRFVLDMPAPMRWFLVNIMIVPRRRKRSARLYQKIQSEQGSPLLFHTRNLASKVASQLSLRDHHYVVEFGMRYGSPSIADSLERLQAAEVERIFALPLYPQYAESSFETAVVETKTRARKLGCLDRLSFLPPFYAQPAFIDACAQRIAEHLQEHRSDHLVFSFHGVPVRHITKLDRSRSHCLLKSDCCEAIGPINENCYRAQCVLTARAIARRLDLEKDSYTISFQSRFGRAEWVEPSLEDVLRNLARRGTENVAVFSPSFVADCLETLEEIAIRGRETFLEAGGGELTLIPSLNAHPAWIAAVTNWILESNNHFRVCDKTRT